MLQTHDRVELTAPASCLVHPHYDAIRSTAPASSMIASDEHRTVLMAGGTSTFRVPWHSHDCFMILMPIRGAINLRDETYRVGTWLSEERFAVVPKSWAHAGEADNTPQILVYLTDFLIGRIASQFGSLSRVQRRLREPLTFSVTPEIRMLQYLCCTGDPTDPSILASRAHIASALLLHILAQVERTEPLTCASNCAHGEGVVKEICSFIDARLAEDVSLNLIAETFRLSRRHTTRLFRRWTGLSIAEYLEQRRIRAANALLRDTTLPIGEIACRLGFESGSALARAIRRVTGESPSTIRRQSTAKSRISAVVPAK